MVHAVCPVSPVEVGTDRLTKASQVLQDALFEPVGRPQGIPAGNVANMAATPGYFQCDRIAQVGFNRQCGFREKRVVSCLQHQGRYGDALQERFTAGVIVIIINSAEAVQRGGDGMIELPERT